MPDVRTFNIATCAEDFAGEGRTITVRNESTGYGTHRGMRILVNGWTLSCQWGFGSYCDGARAGGGDHLDHPPAESSNAEVAAWKGDGGMIQIGDDTVAGWIRPAAVLLALDAAARDDEAGIRAALDRHADNDSEPSA